MKNLKIIKNSCGYYEVRCKYSEEELEKYYSQKYYQCCKGSYSRKYGPEEVQYIQNALSQKYRLLVAINRALKAKSRGMFLDIGAGEGWALSYFMRRGWDVLGLDYSEFGCRSHNRRCLPHLKIGNIYANIDLLRKRRLKFDVILLNNVLEHVVKPGKLLDKLTGLATKAGVVIVQVPNDFSIVQNYLLGKNYIKKRFWVEPPDHLSYFNAQGLVRLAGRNGWTCRKIIGDFPIDLNLFNFNTNYVAKKSKGSSCHKARLEIVNLLHSISPDRTDRLFEALADLGLGRNIIGFFQKSAKRLGG